MLTNKNAALLGASVGFTLSACVLALLWFGVSGVLRVGDTNFVYPMWPSWVMLVGGWRTTIPGIMITVSSVAINCLMYAVIALLLRMTSVKLWGLRR
jgi:hypothetical protein